MIKSLNSKIYFMLTLLFALLISCNSQTNELNTSGNESSKNEDTLKIENCHQKLSADDFDNFLGVNYGMNELVLESKLGAFTGGEYTADSTSFIYYFKKVKGAPVTVWVDSESQQVLTIFMEILGLEELFQADLDEAIAYYDISPCDARFFGMTYTELKTLFGEPAKDEIIKNGVRSVDYDSKDYKYSVNFKFYPDQGDVCSSISVNWFY